MYLERREPQPDTLALLDPVRKERDRARLMNVGFQHAQRVTALFWLWHFQVGCCEMLQGPCLAGERRV
jgi:glutathione S-transferase